ncbi:hypothetical protein OUZ56_008962 [Daphnia magna]|uniref:Uncharacterized protein n=1 Tax=Daphnia magna TaxID=35525 RepID=A0ABR0AEK0_9CRUS|nr:hypothetical protein OUZ56_008962 [Daphnia magna]
MIGSSGAACLYKHRCMQSCRRQEKQFSRTRNVESQNSKRRKSKLESPSVIEHCSIEQANLPIKIKHRVFWQRHRVFAGEKVEALAQGLLNG